MSLDTSEPAKRLGSVLEPFGWGFTNSLASKILNMASNALEGKAAMSVFDEKYRVVAVERDRLLLRGVLSGDVLTIVNSEPEVPLTQEEYPLGKLIALTDPSTTPLN
jgi:hypothetical protein